MKLNKCIFETKKKDSEFKVYIYGNISFITIDSKLAFFINKDCDYSIEDIEARYHVKFNILPEEYNEINQLKIIWNK